MKREMLLGSEAIAEGVRLARPGVIAAYPITPQTHIIETLSEMVDNGVLNARFIKVESEISAAASVLGSATAGVRSFTATSSHGLALMHEMLHWIAGSRIPLVMVNANRAIGAPWNIWTDQTDSMTQRDLGWMQIYCSSSQEALDTIIQAFYISERILLPVMVMIDGFILSHTMEPVIIPDQETVDKFLPEYTPEIYLDPNTPYTFNAAAKGDSFYILKKDIQETLLNSFHIVKDTFSRFKKFFNREYNIVSTYKIEDADFVIIVAGALSGTVRVAIDSLRDIGIKAGLLNLRLFRPFPVETIRNILKDKENVIVLNKSLSYGVSGTITQEIKSALYDSNVNCKIYDFIISIGGKEVFPETIINITKSLNNYKIDETIWIN